MAASFFQPNPEVNPKPWTSRHGPIRKIDFNELDEFVDLYGAYGCIVVLTSDGELGTMTHIGTEVDSVAPFVASLNCELKEHKEKSVVILTGGSALPDSKKLYQDLLIELNKHNYKIVNQFIDQRSKGPLPRISTLYKDKVVVKQFHGSEEKVTELSFIIPKQQKTYTQTRELQLPTLKKK